MTLGFPLGAPGIYEQPDAPLRSISGVRMDVCAFVGVAPRGPTRERLFDAAWADPACRPRRSVQRSVPVAIESWGDYVRLFGAFEGPGLLPYAVHAFFRQGGRRAYVVRIVHEFGDTVQNDQGAARGVLPLIWPETRPPADGLSFVARNEGTWGNRLRVTLDIVEDPIHPLEPGSPVPSQLVVPATVDVPVGTLLGFTMGDGRKELRFVNAVTETWNDQGDRIRTIGFDGPLPEAPSEVAVVVGELSVRELADDTMANPSAGFDDVDQVGPTSTLRRPRPAALRRGERHHHIAFSPLHPRWIAKVVAEESRLLYPHRNWIETRLVLSPDLLRHVPSQSEPFTGGLDRYGEVDEEDFFDRGWVLGDDDPGEGVHSLVDLRDLSLLVVPDLYAPAELPETGGDVLVESFATSRFLPCVEPPARRRIEPQPVGLLGLLLDPSTQLAQIISRQRRLVEFADLMRSFVVLLDVPLGIDQRSVLRWRSQFDSMYAAAYHPWLEVAPEEDERDALVTIPPSAVAAGIIADREIKFGVQYGPANELARGAVKVSQEVGPRQHDTLHPLGVNVFAPERDGLRLTAARTLTRRHDYRQLSVRRLMTMLARVLEQQMQWAVFEPNSAALRGQITATLRAFLRTLFLANAFAGATEDEAFFVRSDEELNPRYITDAGKLVAHVGVAPSEPLEFIVLRITRETEGIFRLEEVT